MKKLALILLLVFVTTTKSQITREQHFTNKRFEGLEQAIRSLSSALESKIEEIKTELAIELQKTSSELQLKLVGIDVKISNIQESLTNLSLQKEQTKLKLEQVAFKISGCNSILTSLALRQNKVLEQIPKIEPSRSNISPLNVTPSSNYAPNLSFPAPALTSSYLDISLPSGSKTPRPHYDGRDGIYLLQGSRQDAERAILKFNISSETLTQVGTLPGPARWGASESDGHGNIFYFGGSESGDEIHLFNTTSNSTRVVASAPFYLEDVLSIKVNDTVLLLGGNPHGRNLLAFNMTSCNWTLITTNLSFYVVDAAAFISGRKALILLAGDEKRVLQLDLESYTMKQVRVESLPEFRELSVPSVGWHGNRGFIFAGYDLHQGNGTYAIYTWNGDTYEGSWRPVKGLRTYGRRFEISTRSVWVKNRMYCFGGASFDGTTRKWVVDEEIFYVEVREPSTVEMASFLGCNNETNGLHPHPSDCSQFIGCHNGNMTVFSCPSPLYFNPVTKGCHFPDQVKCGTACEDKKDGAYPHTEDSGRGFIICRDGVTNVFQCPEGLLFQEERGHCDYPVV